MEYDVLIIGAGPGGYVAAIRAAQRGARVCVVEKNYLGGTCLNQGCIPTKTLITTTNLLRKFQKATRYGINCAAVNVDFPLLIQRKEKIVSALRQGVKELFKSYGIELVWGEARLKSTNSVIVEQKEINAKNIIVATGSKPTLINNIEVDEKDILTSDGILEIKEVPSSLLIIGAGVVGVEFASIFNTLGTKVTIVEMLPKIIPGIDEEISEILKKSLQKDGIEIKNNSTVKEVKREEGKIKVKILEENTVKETTVDKVLVAVGRTPLTKGLGLEEIGVKLDKAKIVVDKKMRTNIPNIYAIGDAIGGILLAHVASGEGIVASENICGKDTEVDYRAIPNCIYTYPEVASVGLSEEEAKQKGYKVVCGKFPFSAAAKALIEDERDGLVKVVADEETKEILGMHIIGHLATELIAEGVQGIKFEATIAEFERISHAHPTLGEAIFEAAQDVIGEAIDLRKK